MNLSRRNFLKASGLLGASVGLSHLPRARGAVEAAISLPEGNAPLPVALPHFPDRLHAFVWRNWTLVPLERMAAVLGATPAQVTALGRSMGLRGPWRITANQQRRSPLTVIRRNWHLLPYSQLLELLNWTPAHLAYILREDDFLYVKLGSHKPKCAPLRYVPPSEAGSKRAREFADFFRKEMPDAFERKGEPLFSFVSELAATSPTSAVRKQAPADTGQAPELPRFCYSYFALYGDPLLEPELEPYPDGYLQRLAAIGVNGVWLQGVLHKLAPFPWLAENERERATRLRNLRLLTERAARHGVGIYLYLNEPRAMPRGFFDAHPQLRGVSEGDYAALCTSVPEVRRALTEAVASICSAVPALAGFFTISASENLTNCWSHGQGASCPRCGKRSAAEVLAEVNHVFHDGIQQAGSKARLLVWDWGWRDEWAPDIIQRLPRSVDLMSVSEWSIPIKRGGIDSVVGEYSISTVGPGPRATKHWALARERGMRVLAKIQAGNTWELSAVPYIPALENVARHATRLKQANVDGLMLGWTLGGYPSPNLQVACAIAAMPSAAKNSNEEVIELALQNVAIERVGAVLAPLLVRAWRSFSQAFSEFPFHGGLVYNAPMQFGPSNLLWAKPTGYHATMIGFPYDDLPGWRQSYPAEVFIDQFIKMADGFDAAIETLQRETASVRPRSAHLLALRQELWVASAAAIHFRSTANQARFVQLRGQFQPTMSAADPVVQQLRAVLRSELALARELFEIQRRDSRIGFEASNHYYYVPQDLLEKMLNCQYLLETWLPAEPASASG